MQILMENIDHYQNIAFVNGFVTAHYVSRKLQDYIYVKGEY